MLTIFFIFINMVIGGFMNYGYSKAYLINYNRMIIMDTNKLLEIALISNNNFLEKIAIRVLLDDNRLLTIDNFEIINLVIKKLAIEDLWDLSKLEIDSLIVKLAKEKIFSIIDETFYQKKKTLSLLK
mgnify:CR=1 FL=1